MAGLEIYLQQNATPCIARHSSEQEEAETVTEDLLPTRSSKKNDDSSNKFASWVTWCDEKQRFFIANT
jgi:hypothetical protein